MHHGSVDVGFPQRNHRQALSVRKQAGGNTTSSHASRPRHFARRITHAFGRNRHVSNTVRRKEVRGSQPVKHSNVQTSLVVVRECRFLKGSEFCTPQRFTTQIRRVPNDHVVGLIAAPLRRLAVISGPWTPLENGRTEAMLLEVGTRAGNSKRIDIARGDMTTQSRGVKGEYTRTTTDFQPSRFGRQALRCQDGSEEVGVLPRRINGGGHGHREDLTVWRLPINQRCRPGKALNLGLRISGMEGFITTHAPSKTQPVKRLRVNTIGKYSDICQNGHIYQVKSLGENWPPSKPSWSRPSRNV